MGIGGFIAAIYIVVADLLSVLKRHWSIGGVPYDYRGFSGHSQSASGRDEDSHGTCAHVIRRAEVWASSCGVLGVSGGRNLARGNVRLTDAGLTPSLERLAA